MPVIELDMLLGLVNRRDRLHKIASNLFDKIISGELKGVKIASSALLEYELVLRSRGVAPEDIYNDILAFVRIRNLGEVPLSARVIINALDLRDRYGLTYSDSLHAASALEYDGAIISTDQIYGSVKELTHLDPRKI